MSYGSLLIHACTISRPVRVAGSNARKITYEIIATGVSCRFAPLDAATKQTILGRIPNAVHRVFFDAGTNIRDNDVLTRSEIDYTAREVIEYPGMSGADHIECIAELKI